MGDAGRPRRIIDSLQELYETGPAAVRELARITANTSVGIRWSVGVTTALRVSDANAAARGVLVQLQVVYGLKSRSIYL